MDVQIECGACAAMLLTRTLAWRTPAWRQHQGPVLAEIAPLMATAPHPGAVLGPMYDEVARRLADGDAYRAAKREANRRMAAWWEAHTVDVADLGARLKLAVAGNAIDAGVDTDIDVIWRHFEQAVVKPLGRDDREKALAWAQSHPGARVLYLMDNAGEAVLDRECMRAWTAWGAHVTAVVKGGPLVNDVTRDDADEIQLSGVAEVLDTGTAWYGTVADHVAPRVWQHWQDADLVVAKGLAHLETLSHEPRRGPTLFMYQAKCPPSARLLGVPPASSVIWWRAADAVLSPATARPPADSAPPTRGW